MRRLLIIGSALAALAPAGVRAQAPAGGGLEISGTSTVRPWTCRETAIASAPAAAAGAAASPTADSASGVTLTFPVGAIDCGDAGMNGHLRSALKAQQHPTIAFALPASEVTRALKAGPVPVRVNGQLTIAGQTRPVQTEVTVTRAPGEGVQVRGEQSLKMTDFGVKPPVLMLGLLKVRDLVHVAFDVMLRAASVGRLSAGRP